MCVQGRRVCEGCCASLFVKEATALRFAFLLHWRLKRVRYKQGHLTGLHMCSYTHTHTHTHTHTRTRTHTRTPSINFLFLPGAVLPKLGMHLG